VKRLGENKTAYGVSVGYVKERDHSEDLRVDER
jgi:hypothetical protein